MLSSSEQRAKDFATLAHSGQKRKYTGEDYIVHPQEVADIVRRIDDSPSILTAAWLHDTVEDTAATHDQIEKQFGRYVSELVWWLTNLDFGTRQERKEWEREHISHAPESAKTIRLADIISNTKNILQLDPGYAPIYLEEKRLLLPSLVGGDHELWLKAKVQIEGV